MLCVNCSSELGEAGKWRHRDDEDRLSNLPEPILYHILSFLDTKSAVRTSKLSRVWNRLWKHVSVLDLRQDCFGDDPYPFEKFVDKVLSVRYPVKLHKLTYVQNFAPWSEDHTRMFAKVIKYAFSHDAQHLVFDTGSRCQLFDRAYRFSSLFHSYPTHNQFVTRSKTSNSTFNLKTLELRCVALDSGFLLCSRLPMLTTLKVTSCLLLGTDSYTNEPKDCLDLFSNFGGLVNLAISDCYFLADPRVRPFLRVRVSGLQLLSLELEGMEKIRIEIFAPKLRFFSVRQDVNDSQGFSELSLPSLDRAEIELNHIHRKEAYVHHDQYLNALFQGLHNAKSLKLGYSTVEV
ncbi:unnamed protein product [Linum tenue]|uniref:F-box domain-containing protein n=1 Tax=Linum tenue TaxID=586396 RepID=A0AAV0JWI4_9ROSI|nr:unnamed protein product [Linum tenue]